LEEADELADRAGIILGGRMVAEGPRAKRKRSIGNVVIVARRRTTVARHVRAGLAQLGKSLLAIGVVGMVSMTMRFAALR
jgi:ABC-type multidrug transport system ATPase subunit